MLRFPISQRIPPGSWDSHMHTIDPTTFPLSPDAVYTPTTHDAASARAFESSLGMDKLVLVQPSIYGADNSCLLDSLSRLGGPATARAVVGIDHHDPPDPATLRAWHAAGVRGLRINLHSTGRAVTAAELASLLAAHADVARPVGWAVQLYVPMPLLDALEPLVPSLGVRVVIDHMGQPPADGNLPTDPYAQPGFAALVRLLRGGSTFVKLSAPYRLGKGDVEPLAREILRVAGRARVVFATDWPHTRFEGLDIRPWVDKVLEMCGGDEKLIERVFRGNAEDLWGGN